MKHESLTKLWKKYRYACAVLLVGLLILFLPGKAERRGSETTQTTSLDMPSADEASEKLEDTLRQIRGVGEVHVLLSYKTSEERFYTKDEGETVLLSSGSGTQSPLEKKIVYPTFLGAIIVCDGASDAVVKGYIYDAVQQYTGLRSDQISVLPLRHN